MDKAGHTVSVTQFADLTGVSRDRLRTWERRFGFPQPVRYGRGPRRYHAEDAARVVAVRRAAEEGVPLAEAIARSAGAQARPRIPTRTFGAMVEASPMPIALVAGPEPLTLAWANSALYASGPTLRLGDPLAGFPALREHFVLALPPREIQHPPWSGTGPPGRSLVYRLPVGPGERALIAVVGLETPLERGVREDLEQAEAQLDALRARAARHDRWLDGIASLAEAFQHDTGPDVLGAALDVLIDQTRAVDAALADYVAGRLVIGTSRRGVIGGRALTVAAHPEIARALRDLQAVWLDRTVGRLLGVSDPLEIAGIPIAVAGQTLGLVLMTFESIEPHDEDNRRLLAAISAAMGFALLRDRLVGELRAATVSREAAPSAQPGAAG